METGIMILIATLVPLTMTILGLTIKNSICLKKIEERVANMKERLDKNSL